MANCVVLGSIECQLYRNPQVSHRAKVFSVTLYYEYITHGMYLLVRKTRLRANLRRTRTGSCCGTLRYRTHRISGTKG